MVEAAGAKGPQPRVEPCAHPAPAGLGDPGVDPQRLDEVVDGAGFVGSDVTDARSPLGPIGRDVASVVLRSWRLLSP